MTNITRATASVALSLFFIFFTVFGLIENMWEGCDWIIGIVLACISLWFAVDAIINE